MYVAPRVVVGTVGTALTIGSVYYGWKWMSGAVDSGKVVSETMDLPAGVASPLTRSLYKTYLNGFLMYPTALLAVGAASDAAGFSKQGLAIASAAVAGTQGLYALHLATGGNEPVKQELKQVIWISHAAVACLLGGAAIAMLKS